MPRSLFFLFLYSPLAVYALPGFQSTYAEDLLLLAWFVYLWLRFLNQDRLIYSPAVHATVQYGLHALPLSIAWFGLVRGYLDLSGRWLAVFPVLLLLAAYCRPSPPPERRSIESRLPFLHLFVTAGVFGMLLLWRLAVTPEVKQIARFSLSAVMPGLIVFPILSCLSLAAPSLPSLHTRKDHLLLLAAASVVFVLVWKGNVETGLRWYRAGELERSWAPMKFNDPKQIAEIEKRPYEAAIEYQRVYRDILRKGDIPRYLNWPFFLRYRMAYQGMRKKDPPFCARSLPPLEIDAPEKIRLLKRLWHIEFINNTPDREPEYTPEGRVWVDFEFDPEGTLYALDCWGRVYSRRNDTFYLEYDPDADFRDAVDLEWIGATFACIRSNGEIHCPLPLPFSEAERQKPSTRGDVIDFECARSGETWFVTTSHGEMYTIGRAPSEFPNWEKLQFYEPVIADMELEPDGKGYYLLDIYGAVHSNHVQDTPSLPHRSPEIDSKDLPYWYGQRMAVDLEIDSRGREMYVYNRRGEAYTISPHPIRPDYKPPRTYPFRGVCLKTLPDGTLAAVESSARVVPLPETAP